MPLQPTPETIKALQAIAEELFEVTEPSRATIRVDTPNDRDYPVLGEARAPGVSSLTGGMSPRGYKPNDIHQSPVIQRLKSERAIIVQRDVRVDSPPLPLLVDYYGITGQVLTPLEHDGEFVGLVSLHSVEPREWTEEDLEAVKDATERTHRVLEQATWVVLE